MPIYPLPQFEEDLKLREEEDRKAYEALKAPKTLVVRFGSMKLIGEFPYDGEAKPGCGSKMVVRTFRGTELGEMLTSTCPNSGCSKSVSRQQMLQYIQNSGGRDYPFFTDGRVLRVATKEDLDRQAAIEQSKHGLKVVARGTVQRLGLDLKVVEVEPILGGERVTVYCLSEHRVESRDLARELGYDLKARVEVRHVGARDEARLTADFEKCGQYCCCKNFLKVLKPISMKSAKTQKATLEPLKISGRCGRLMCCLRYEDQTYDDLKARLPRRKSRVGTPEGDGTVVDGQILTQLVLVLLDTPDPAGVPRQIAVAVEDLSEAVSKTAPPPSAPAVVQYPRRGGPGVRGPGGPGGVPGGSGMRRDGGARGGVTGPAGPKPRVEDRSGREGAGGVGGSSGPGGSAGRPASAGPVRPRDGSSAGPRREVGPGPGPEGNPPRPKPPAPRPMPEGEVVFDSEGNEIRGGDGVDRGPAGEGGDESRRRRRRRRRRSRRDDSGPGGGSGGGGGGSGPGEGGGGVSGGG
ncbi:MAG: hypothetical protein HRU70_09125 [Phycisphaeraceae bacterium]|nr:MAG: hypothetical protein HRU70_09125 [Phycisphaeraceae bacterium]